MNPESSLPPLKCKFCRKEFIKQERYDKHKLLCIEKNTEYISNTLNLYETETETLKTHTLHDIVTELVKSNNQLRKEVNELKKWVQTKKKKIVIVDWLNQNSKPQESYKEYISKLKIERTKSKVFSVNFSLIVSTP